MNDRTLPVPATLPEEAQAELQSAVAVLEGVSLPMRLAALVGSSVDSLRRRLPGPAQRLLTAAVERALGIALRTALRSEPARNPTPLSGAWLHRGLLAASGVAGGALGLPGTLLELPVSTTLLLRQVAAIAAEQGEDLARPEVQAECLKVFALGGRDPADDAAESGYFALRLALAETLQGTVGRGLAGLLPGFLGAVAARFGAPVAVKLSAQAAPLLGAAGGAAVNLAFLEHFRGIATAHFTIRRLERRHGPVLVRAAYEALRAA
ncbi:EcsC family protein [Siccirubricoccus sp. KC 17139]|uniref:EcsC family protein n=1 Tax=Siccirubricoccus soli TaxID=2899147 RepID=A0ABT1D6L6_9PROT|nr:EcsC family protein [Siccirubricoccus soli]MCO6416640.1 EcsC family protein [Siccirubricoccus soli]MCP2682775.1 EcsC family protein [Siccirubricoccus soli]